MPGIPLLRQYEAQLNATLRPGLGRWALPELSREAAQLAATVLVYGVSTSARRLMGKLVASTLAMRDEGEAAAAGNQEEEEDGFDEEDSDEQDKPQHKTDYDDVDSSQLLLAKCAALARLYLAARDRPGGAMDEGGDGDADVHTREDARAAIAKALPLGTLKKLVGLWLAICRDFVVLSLNKGLLAPKRHPEALYQGGRTATDVAALLPAYSKAWPMAAQAAAEAVGSPAWTGRAEDAALLVAVCAKAVDREEEPVRALQALACLAGKGKGLGFNQADVIKVVVGRGHRAWARGKKLVVVEVLHCLHVVLANPNSEGVFKGDALLWQLACELVLGQLVGRVGHADACTAALACLQTLARHCPSAEYAPFLLNASASANAVGLCDFGLVADTLRECAKINAQDKVDAVLSDVLQPKRLRQKKDPKPGLVLFMSADVFSPLLREAAKVVGECLKADNDPALRRQTLAEMLGLVDKRKKQGAWLVAMLASEICDTLDDASVGVGALEIWQRVFLQGDAKRVQDLGWAWLLRRVGKTLAKDPLRKDRAAFGAFLLASAKASSGAFKAALAGMSVEEKKCVEESVRLALAG